MRQFSLLLLLPVSLCLPAPLCKLGLSLGQRATGAAVELGTTIGGAVLLRETVMDARWIPTESMLPTFEVGDLLLLDKVSLRLRPPARGDVVCFQPPPALRKLVPDLNRGRRDVCCIKRVVAVEGDEVRVSGGRLLVNGAAPAEPYVASRIKYSMRSRRVPAGHVFVLGDNRNDSYDSHVWGALPVELLIGLPLATYWPPKRVRRRRAYSLAPG